MYTIVESGRLDHAFFMAAPYIDARRFFAEARAGFVDAGLADMEKEIFRFSERSTNKAPKPDVKVLSGCFDRGIPPHVTLVSSAAFPEQTSRVPALSAAKVI
jgi:hypothetical protein